MCSKLSFANHPETNATQKLKHFPVGSLIGESFDKGLCETHHSAFDWCGKSGFYPERSGNYTDLKRGGPGPRIYKIVSHEPFLLQRVFIELFYDFTASRKVCDPTKPEKSFRV